MELPLMLPFVCVGPLTEIFSPVFNSPSLIALLFSTWVVGVVLMVRVWPPDV
jgi:hypothetical protein